MSHPVYGDLEWMWSAVSIFLEGLTEIMENLR